MAEINMEKFQKKISDANLDALVVGGPDNINYLLNYRNYDNIVCQRNFRDQSGALVIPKKGGVIFLSEVATQYAEATKRLPFITVKDVPWDVPDIVETLADVLKQNGLVGGALGMDMDYTPARWIEELRRHVPGAAWSDASMLLSELRMKKTEKEMEFIKKSITALEAGFLAVGKELKDGQKPQEMHFVFGHAVLSAGGLPEFSSAGAVALEWGTPSYPQWFGYTDTVEKDRTFRFDACASYEFYLSDMMRTFYLGGEPSEKLRNDYQRMHEFKETMLGFVRVGITLEELNEKVKDARQKAGMSFYGIHGIGLVVHEWPFLFTFKTKIFEDTKQMVLQENMVFCLEVSNGSVDDQGRRMGMGEEDMYFLKKDGPVRLTSLPQEVLSVSG